MGWAKQLQPIDLKWSFRLQERPPSGFIKKAPLSLVGASDSSLGNKVMALGSLDLETLISGGIKGLSPKIQPNCLLSPSFWASLPVSLCPLFLALPLCLFHLDHSSVSLSPSLPFFLPSRLHVIVWTSLFLYNNLSASDWLPPPTPPLVIQDSTRWLPITSPAISPSSSSSFPSFFLSPFPSALPQPTGSYRS